MRPPQKERGMKGIISFVSIIILAFLFVLILNSVSVQASVIADITLKQEDDSINKSIDPGTIASLNCIDMSEKEISNRLGKMSTERINNLIREGAAAFPDSVRNAMAGERINIQVGSVYFAAVVNENSRVVRLQTSRISDPTVRAETDCETVKEILTAESERRALAAAISQGDIRWEGVGTTRDAAVSYGKKTVQAVHILNSGKTGSVNDAADGFTSGLTMGLGEDSS